MSHSCRTKTQEGERFSRNRPFLAQGCTIEAGWSDNPTQKLLLRSWIGPENFIKILSFHQKFQFFLNDRQTGWQTHALPSIYGQANFLMPVFNTFHFTKFVKDNYKRISKNIIDTLNFRMSRFSFTLLISGSLPPLALQASSAWYQVKVSLMTNPQ